jgi:hypothetical protein
MIVAKLKALAKFIFKCIAILLALLILLYVGFKVWDYQVIEIAQSEKRAAQNRQKNKFEDLSRDQAAYAPLMVGSSSLDYVRGGNREFIFTYLLGSDFKIYQELMEDSGQIVYVGKQILGSGCKKQFCKEAEAAFVIDPESGKFYAAINQNNELHYYGIEDRSPIPLAFEKWHGTQAAGGAK